MQIKKILLPVAASAILLGACGNNASSSKDEIIESKAGDVKVEDVMNKLGKDQIASTSFDILLSKALKEKYGDKVDEDKIDKQIENEQSQVGGKTQYKKIMKQQGTTIDQHKEDLKTQAYQKELVKDKIKVSDKTLKDQVKDVSHILIGTKQSSDDKDGLSDKEAKKKADEIYKKVKDNPDLFNEIAQKESDDEGSAKQNGKIGYVFKGQMIEKFEDKLFKMKRGSISKPVKTEYGYHIIYNHKISDKDFKKNKSDLKSQYVKQKIQNDPNTLINAYKSLLKEYDVSYKDKDIEKVINDKVLNADKIKEQQDQMQQSQMQQ